MKRSSVLIDALIGLVFAVVVVVALTVVGNSQVSRYRDVVTRIDHNADAIVCILRIQPDQRTIDNVNACVRSAGLTPRP
jgi:hypothetical protein